MVIFGEMIKAKELIPKAANQAIGRGIPVVAMEYPLDGCMNAKYDYSDGFENSFGMLLLTTGLPKSNLLLALRVTVFPRNATTFIKKSLPSRVYPTTRSVLATVSFGKLVVS